MCSTGGAGRPVDGRGNRGELYIGRGAPASEGTSATPPMEMSAVAWGWDGGEIWAWSDCRLTLVMLSFAVFRGRGAGDGEESRARAAVGPES